MVCVAVILEGDKNCFAVFANVLTHVWWKCVSGIYSVKFTKNDKCGYISEVGYGVRARGRVWCKCHKVCVLTSMRVKTRFKGSLQMDEIKVEVEICRGCLYVQPGR